MSLIWLRIRATREGEGTKRDAATTPAKRAFIGIASTAGEDARGSVDDDDLALMMMVIFRALTLLGPHFERVKTNS